MDNIALWNLLREKLYSDLDEQDDVFTKKPLLAHYTTLDTLEKILVTNELWFSNPLFMNDLDEVRFGILKGAEILREDESLRTAWGSEKRYRRFIETLDSYISNFEKEHLLDTYIFCMSEHTRGDTDGVLSMWRGYGGNGRGVALVFDTAELAVVDESPLLIAKVAYGSTDDRMARLRKVVETFIEFLSLNVFSDDQIHLASAALFERIKMMALLMKHRGFDEENEWRAIYFPDRDEANKLSHMRGYFNGPRGVEPKLKFKVEPINGVTNPDFSFDRFLSSILLGPSNSSLLANRSISRMLELMGRAQLADKLEASSIPFRII